MFFLSPAKLLIILVVALVVLGPDKLPKMAKQIGGFWSDFSKFREKLESEVRGTFPDLPTTDTIAQAVRSPLSFLDTLSGDPSTDQTVSEGPGGAESTGVSINTVRAESLLGVSGAGAPVGTVQEAPIVPPESIAIGHQIRLGQAPGVEHSGMK